MTKDITIEEFDGVLAEAGLTLDAAERARLYEGYKGLQGLLARLPQDAAMEAEPVTVALLPGSKVVR
jgi:hypothetical protein